MTQASTGKSNSSILDFYEVNGRLSVVNRLSLEVWAWNAGSWESDMTSANLINVEGTQLAQDEFVRRFPMAALALLETETEE